MAPVHKIFLMFKSLDLGCLDAIFCCSFLFFKSYFPNFSSFVRASLTLCINLNISLFFYLCKKLCFLMQRLF